MVQHNSIDHTGVPGVGGGIAATLLDAKGDLIAASASDTAARLAVGTNGKVLTAASGETTGLKWTSPAGTLLGLKVYQPGSPGSWSTTSATQADIDATNAAVTFTAPESTNVLVRITALVHNAAGAKAGYLGLRESTTNIITKQQVVYDLVNYVTISRTFYLAGISAGAHTYKAAFATDTVNTFSVYYGEGNGEFTMEVWAAP